MTYQEAIDALEFEASCTCASEGSTHHATCACQLLRLVQTMAAMLSEEIGYPMEEGRIQAMINKRLAK